jgi:1-phosphatidylinositol-3-phosphate 5-kinase
MQLDISPLQTLLSDFRARGGRIPWSVTQRSCDQVDAARRGEDTESREGSSVVSTQSLPDCLDPFNHQRISVLFSSFSYESANAPAPCVSPW